MVQERVNPYLHATHPAHREAEASWMGSVTHGGATVPGSKDQP